MRCSSLNMDGLGMKATGGIYMGAKKAERHDSGIVRRHDGSVSISRAQYLQGE